MTETLREIVISNLRLRGLAEDLPARVFPVDITIELSRSRAKDNFLSDENGAPISKGKNYPFHVKTPRPKPYIPRTTVRFTNPVECNPGNEKNWEFSAFSELLPEILDRIEDAGTKEAAQRVYITDLRLVEVAEEYTQPRSGGKEGLRVTPDAYTDNENVGIFSFSKRATVPQEILGKITEDIAPGKVIQPLKLTSVKEVTLKEYQKARPRRKYYRSATKAHPDAKPDEFSGDDVTWGLATRLGERLANSETIVPVEWQGHTEDKETFIMDDATVLDPDDF